MCSIVGSFSKKTLIDLCELNAYRGQHSHSISYFNPEQSVYYTQKNFGVIDYDKIDPAKGDYIIAHMQAPTTDNKNSDCIHPACNNPYADDMLWHNGIIKEKEVERLREKYQLTSTWDTYILLHHLIVGGSLSDIDGSFSCLWFDDSSLGYHGLKLFRNEISPMFIDDNANISSTKFEGSIATEPNVILGFNPFSDQTLTVMDRFETKENPYYFGD